MQLVMDIKDEMVKVHIEIYVTQPLNPSPMGDHKVGQSMGGIGLGKQKMDIGLGYTSFTLGL